MQRRRGASAVEFALTVPVLLGLLGGIIEYGNLLSAYQAVANIAHDAAARGATFDQDDDAANPTAALEAQAVSTAVELMTAYGIAGDSTNVTTQVDAGTLLTLTVTVNVSYAPLFSLVPSPSTLERSHTIALQDQG